MNYTDFVARVEKDTGMARDDLSPAISADLVTFGQLLTRQHRKHLMKQLPCELQPDLESKKEEERFSVEDFYGRIAARARLRFHDAMKLTHGVLRALSEAAGGELKDILASLPTEYRELIENGPGHSSAVDLHRSESDILNASPR